MHVCLKNNRPLLLIQRFAREFDLLSLTIASRSDVIVDRSHVISILDAVDRISLTSNGGSQTLHFIVTAADHDLVLIVLTHHLSHLGIGTCDQVQQRGYFERPRNW